MKNISRNEGFTLIEILVVIGIIAILATIVLIAINPARQFAQAHNTQRTSNVSAILDAIGQNIADNKGVFKCAAGTLPQGVANAKIMASAGGYDIRTCLVTTYMSELPVDPTPPGAAYDGTNYNTGYEVFQDTATNRITVYAPNTELTASPCSVTSNPPTCISITR